MSDEIKKDIELKEEDLEAAAGGDATANRYDPQRCGNAKEVLYECVGFLQLVICDHYRKRAVNRETYHHTCAMGCYDYYGSPDGKGI